MADDEEPSSEGDSSFEDETANESTSAREFNRKRKLTRAVRSAPGHDTAGESELKTQVHATTKSCTISCQFLIDCVTMTTYF